MRANKAGVAGPAIRDGVAFESGTPSQDLRKESGLYKVSLEFEERGATFPANRNLPGK